MQNFKFLISSNQDPAFAVVSTTRGLSLCDPIFGSSLLSWY